MFLNYMAGAVSLVLAISAFTPWVTVWFYSLKGIEHIHGIGILIVGILGVAISIFQHLAGKMRGRAFIGLSIIALTFEGFYFSKMVSIGSELNKVVEFLKNAFGDVVIQKVQQVLGEHWTKILGSAVQMFGIKPSVSSFDFLGGGLILAVISSLILLVVGILLEKSKTIEE